LLLFPPKTQEVQFDEKWSFVAKKEKHCDRADPVDNHKGECWDHIAFDPEHRLVLSVAVGKRTAENVEAVVKDFYARTEGRLMRLITTDEYSCYETTILEAYGQTVVPERTGRPGRPKAPYKVVPEELCYATVRKTRKKGRVEEIIVGAVFGSLEMIEVALKHSRVSQRVNTAFIERYNGTDRNFNARKVRKTYCFSKDWQVHEAVTYFSMYSYNFCWEVRTVGELYGKGPRRGRTPAMAAGLADHVWSLKEWLSFPTVQYI
jgi:IS1 family transposase